MDMSISKMVYAQHEPRMMRIAHCCSWRDSRLATIYSRQGGLSPVCQLSKQMPIRTQRAW